MADGDRRRDTATSTDVVYTVLYVRTKAERVCRLVAVEYLSYAAAGCRVASSQQSAGRSATKLLAGFRDALYLNRAPFRLSSFVF